MTSDECKYGFEVEFHADTTALIQTDQFNHFFVIGTDTTALDVGKNRYNGYGREIRHRDPVNKTDLILSLNALYDFIRFNKDVIHAHGKTGFHLHFSHPTHNFPILRFYRKLQERYALSVHRPRHAYCLCAYGERRSIVRCVDRATNHWEARIFNGSLNIRAIRNYLNFMFSLIDEESV